jgi:hypothetical protein
MRAWTIGPVLAFAENMGRCTVPTAPKDSVLLVLS